MDLFDFGLDVSSDLDRRVVVWLVDTVGADQVAAAVARIPAGQRRYPSAVVRALGVEVPAAVRMSPADAEVERAKGVAGRAKLRGQVEAWRATQQATPAEN